MRGFIIVLLLLYVDVKTLFFLNLYQSNEAVDTIPLTAFQSRCRTRHHVPVFSPQKALMSGTNSPGLLSVSLKFCVVLFLYGYVMYNFNEV